MRVIAVVLSVSLLGCSFAMPDPKTAGPMNCSAAKMAPRADLGAGITGGIFALFMLAFSAPHQSCGWFGGGCSETKFNSALFGWGLGFAAFSTIEFYAAYDGYGKAHDCRVLRDTVAPRPSWVPPPPPAPYDPPPPPPLPPGF